MLTGTVRSRYDLDDSDFRRTNPRFTEQNFARNLASAEEVRSIAEEVGCTPGQLSPAWLLAQGDDIARLGAITPAAGDHHHTEQMRLIEQ